MAGFFFEFEAIRTDSTEMLRAGASRTTMRDCMEGGVHGKKQKDIGAGSKPSYPRIGLEFDYEPFSLAMPSHFEDYKGGRIPGEALLDSAKRDFWKVGRLKSLVKHQDGSSPPASRDGPR